MRLRPEHIRIFEEFLDRIKGETYPEVPSLEHNEISDQMIDLAFDKRIVAAGMEVLDVGCGQGLAIERFQSRGCKVTGISLNAIDVDVCVKKGYDVREMDQSFLDFEANRFDFVWCRHCLEHSIFPFFTLAGFNRVLKPGGWLYLEVPAPDTASRHQANRNHYSVLGKTMWAELLHRSGFGPIEVFDITFRVPVGPDLYWALVQQKLE